MVCLDFTQCQGLGFHLQVDLGIDIRRLQGHVSQPGPNRIDVDAGTQQMNGGRVSDRMRTHPFGRQRGQLCRRLVRQAFHQRMETKAREGSLTAIEEDALSRRTLTDECCQRVHGRTPEGARTAFVPFPPQLDRGRMGQCEVGNRHVDGLTRPCTRAIEKE